MNVKAGLSFFLLFEKVLTADGQYNTRGRNLKANSKTEEELHVEEQLKKISKDERITLNNCKDVPGWVSSIGGFDCDWLKVKSDFGCVGYDWLEDSKLGTATKNCCWCRGGKKSKSITAPRSIRPSSVPMKTPRPTPYPTISSFPSLSPTNSTVAGTTTKVIQNCTDSSSWKDREGDGCFWYYDIRHREAERCKNFGNGWTGVENGLTANEACCFCKEIHQCVDVAGWVDGNNDGCDWYSSNGFGVCKTYGDYIGKDGLTANQACCFCKQLVSPPTDLSPAPTAAKVVPP